MNKFDLVGSKTKRLFNILSIGNYFIIGEDEFELLKCF